MIAESPSTHLSPLQSLTALITVLLPAGLFGSTLSSIKDSSTSPIQNSAALIALRGSLVIDGPSGRRQVDADSFFTGFLETALSEEEMLVEVRVPKMPESTWSFQKFNRRAQDWAIVGSAVVINNDSCGVGLVNMDSRPIRASAVEEAISNGASATEASELAAEGCEPPADINAGVDYRRHLARVLTRRGLEESGR